MTTVPKDKSKNDDRNRNKDKMKGKQFDSSKHVQWHLDENNTILLESDFAKSIAAKSIGALKIHKSANYDSFKPLFFDDPRNNPPLANAHISNEFDAQVEGAKRAWNKKGNKFAVEARFQRKDDNGPSKPCEVPYTFEKPQKYFGRHRQIRPFARALVYTRPVHRNIVRDVEEDIGPGPTAYNPHPDTWAESSKSTCGFLKGISSFLGQSRSRTSVEGLSTENAFHTRANSNNFEGLTKGSVIGAGGVVELYHDPLLSPLEQPSPSNKLKTSLSTSAFSFSKSTNELSALDITNGTTEKVPYRRFRLEDGSVLIAPADKAPEGAVFEPAWGTSHLLAEADPVLSISQVSERLDGFPTEMHSPLHGLPSSQSMGSRPWQKHQPGQWQPPYVPALQSKIISSIKDRIAKSRAEQSNRELSATMSSSFRPRSDTTSFPGRGSANGPSRRGLSSPPRAVMLAARVADILPMLGPDSFSAKIHGQSGTAGAASPTTPSEASFFMTGYAPLGYSQRSVCGLDGLGTRSGRVNSGAIENATKRSATLLLPFDDDVGSAASDSPTAGDRQVRR